MTKTEAAKEPTYVEIDGEKFETVEVNDRGRTYVIREVTVSENDVAEDAALEMDPKTKEEKFNSRIHMRFLLATAIVSPPTTMDDIAKWPGTRYVRISRAYNKLNLVGPETDPNDPRQDG